MTSRTPRFSLSRFCRLARKELRETLRDRRTILTLVLMPVLVYPLLGLTFQRFLLSQSSFAGATRPEYILGFASEADAEVFRPLLTGGEQLVDARDANDEMAFPDFKVIVPAGASRQLPRDLVTSGAADLGIVLQPQATGAQFAVELVYNPNLPSGAAARRDVERRLLATNERWLKEALGTTDIRLEPPVALAIEPVASTGGSGLLVAAIVPLVLLLMTVTGAVYPAIDLTAGERERGTLEMVMAAPTRPGEILAAKYVAVLCVAVLTAVINLCTMTATAFAVGLDGLLFGSNVGLITVFQVLGVLVVLASFFSAVLLLVTSFARSFKEAQAYLIPLMLVSLAPGIVSLMPHLSLTPTMAVTPLVGVVLVARDLLSGGAELSLTLLCLLSTLCYAGLTLALAAKSFGTDSVLYGSEGTWTELLRPRSGERKVPLPSVAWGSLAVLLPAFLLLSGMAGRLRDLEIGSRLLLSAALTVLLFFGMSAAAAWLLKVDWRRTFNLRSAPTLAFIGAMLLGVALWPFAYELNVLLLSESRIGKLFETFATLQTGLQQVPLPIILFTLAIVPAVCEEWFFRGWLFSIFRQKMVAVRTVLLTALLFGLFHVVVHGTLLPERFAASALLGVVLGTVCERTGSLWPAILLHTLHNALLLSIASYQTELAAAGWGIGDERHLSAAVLVTAGLIVAVGGTTIWLWGSKVAKSETAIGESNA